MLLSDEVVSYYALVSKTQFINQFTNGSFILAIRKFIFNLTWQAKNKTGRMTLQVSGGP